MHKIIDYFSLLKKYNTVSMEYEVLKEQVKEDLFHKTINKIGEPDELKRLREENKKLRLKIKELKKMV